MSTTIILGAWIAVFLTLGIFSYLYKDNPFYKTAEHLFVCISAGYWTSLFFWTQIQPNLFGRLWPSSNYSSDSFWYMIYNGLGFFYSPGFPNGGVDKGHEIHNVVLGVPNVHYLIPFALGIMIGNNVAELANTFIDGIIMPTLEPALKRVGGKQMTVHVGGLTFHLEKFVQAIMKFIGISIVIFLLLQLGINMSKPVGWVSIRSVADGVNL